MAKNTNKNVAENKTPKKKSGTSLESFRVYVKKNFDNALSARILQELKDNKVSTVESAIIAVQQLTNVTVANSLREKFKV